MNETIGLKLEADASDWEKAFTSATKDAAKLGKEVEETRDAFEDMGKSLTTRMGSIGGQLTKATTAVDLFGAAIKSTEAKTKSLGERMTGLNQTFEVLGKVAAFGKKAVELAKWSQEFQRLERAIPVEKMRQLERETQGTASKFELMQRAAKELGLAATAGMDDTQLALKRTLTNWENTFDSMKAAVGSFITEIIVQLGGLDRGLDGLARRNVRERARQEQKNETPFATFGGLRAAHADLANPDAVADELRRVGAADFKVRVGTDLANITLAGVAADRNARGAEFLANLKGAIPRFGNAKDEKDVFRALFGADTPKKSARAPRPDEGFFWNLNPNNPNAVQNQPWGARATNALGGAGGAALADFRGEDSLFGGISGIAGGIGNLAGGAASGISGGLDSYAAAAAAKAKQLEELQAKFADTSQATGAAYQTVMTGMAAGLSAALDAAISGSEGFAKAAARASAGALKAVAMESGVKALFATAEGIFGLNPKGFAAAGVYAATAAAAGVAAAALGAAAGPMPSASAGGPRSIPGGGFAPNRASGGSSGVTENHYHIHGTVSAASHKELGAVLEKTKNKAMTSGKARSEHVRTVRTE